MKRHRVAELPQAERAHVFDMKVLVDSEISEDIVLFFCTGCGRPRPPKLRGITRDSACVQLPPAAVEKKVRDRIHLVLAMVGGGHDHTKKGDWARTVDKRRRSAGPRI